jgi:hypothetical protein
MLINATTLKQGSGSAEKEFRSPGGSQSLRNQSTAITKCRVRYRRLFEGKLFGDVVSLTGSLEDWRSSLFFFFYSQRQTGFFRSSGAGSCGMSGNRTQPGWLAVNPQTVPSSHSANNPLEAVLIWMILLTPRHPLPVISQAPYERRRPSRPPSQLSALASQGSLPSGWLG